MPQLIRYDTRNRVAVITVDNPPVNALGPGVLGRHRGGRRARLGRSGRRRHRAHRRGLDVHRRRRHKIFGTLKTREQSLARSEVTHALLRRIEDARKPLVAAIHGNALGGGLEVAMACHYRVMASGRQGRPAEVMLGIIPGAGGTQRLPRLCGAAMAIEMCTGGQAGDGRQGAGGRHRGPRRCWEPAGRARWRSRRRRAAERPIRRTRDLTATIADRADGSRPAPRPGRRCALGQGPAGAAQGRGRDRGRRSRSISTPARRASASCSPTASSRPSRRRCVHLFFAEREAAKVPDVPKDTPVTDDRARGGGRRGHHGRRHRHDLRQRRHPGAAQGGRRRGAPARPRDDPQELRVVRGQGPDDREALAKTLALITPTTTLRRLRATSTSSSRRCSRTWTSRSRSSRSSAA